MARTPSTMLPLGTAMPEFSLPNFATNAKTTHVDSRNLGEQKGYLVAFICNHCPFVIHIQDQIAAVFKNIQELGIYACAINANDVIHYPDDSPENMTKTHKSVGYTFDYLFDETQTTAKQFDAACTPEFYLFNHKKELVYRGQFDESRPGNSVAVTGEDLWEAASNLAAGKEISDQQKPSLGCNIKWRT